MLMSDAKGNSEMMWMSSSGGRRCKGESAELEGAVVRVVTILNVLPVTMQW
jgi:hypothetical protein